MEVVEDLNVSQTIVGTCESMCPSKERIMREREGLLYHFEVAGHQQGSSTRRPIADPERTVKEYSRPAAGRIESDPADLRPAPVLKQTMNYLLHDIATMTTPAWQEIYAFVFDRTRAVRQDMVIQGISGQDAISILEQAVQFHAYAAYRLRHAKIEEFDPVINKHHLLECLKRLLYLYRVTKGTHCNRANFEAVYLLDNLGDEIAMIHYLDLPLELRNNYLLKAAFEINKNFSLRNYRRVFKLIEGLISPICLCVVSCHLFNLRVNYLQILSHGYNVKNCQFPVSELAHLLHLVCEEEAVEICTDCGLMDLFDENAMDFIQFNKSKFQRPSKEKPISSFQVLDTLLMSSSLSDILLGSKLQNSCPPTASSSKNRTAGPNAIREAGDSLSDQLRQMTLGSKGAQEPVEGDCHRERYSINGTILSEGCKTPTKEGNMSSGPKNLSGDNVKMGGVVNHSPFATQGRGRGRGRGRLVKS